MIRVTSLDDPAIAPYRNLKDRELAAMGGLFIAEGEHVTRRLLASPTHQTHSVLLADHRVEAVVPAVPPGVPVYTGPREMVSQIVGYPFHSGVMAIGRRPTPPALLDCLGDGSQPSTMLICPEVINHDNLGALIRIAAGFGASAMLVGPKSCDPYWRRSVRVSMGTVFSLPVVRSDDLGRDLRLLRQQAGMALVATVLDDEAVPLSKSRRADLPHEGRRVGLLVGSESQGLDDWTVSQCDLKMTIPMQLGTDSLNIAVAAAVFLHHYTSQ